jgi:hypothetical protein
VSRASNVWSTKSTPPMHVRLNPARVRSVGHGMCLNKPQQFKMLNVLRALFGFLCSNIESVI